jgi:hypothetical protein
VEDEAQVKPFGFPISFGKRKSGRSDMKTSMKKVSVFASAIFLLATTYAMGGPSPVGVVMSVKGDLMRTGSGKPDKKVVPGLLLFPESKIVKAAEGRGQELQIATADDMKTYRIFPVSLTDETLKEISEQKLQNYVAAIGGAVLRGDAEGGNAGELFDWYCDVGTIEVGRRLVLSEKVSSLETKNLEPLSFKLKKGTALRETSYSILVDDSGKLQMEGGTFTKTNEGWTFAFPGFDKAKDGVAYRVECRSKTVEGLEVRWSFTFRILDKERFKAIETAVAKRQSGCDTPFDKAMARAAVYKEEGLNLKALQVLEDAGVDLGGVL